VGDDWDIHTESISDYIAASGNYSANWYADRGFPRERIKITGMPQWDVGYSINLPSRSEARRVLGVEEDAFLLIYASTWGQLTSLRGGFENEYEHSMREVIEATQELGATLCVKMHPGEAANQEQIYLQIIKDNKVSGFVTRGFNEYVLRAGDILVSHSPSNICCQAAAIGLRSCYFPTEGFEFPFPGPVRVAGTSLTHAIKITQSLDWDKTWEIFARETNDAHPIGNACERIVEFVRSVCQ